MLLYRNRTKNLHRNSHSGQFLKRLAGLALLIGLLLLFAACSPRVSEDPTPAPGLFPDEPDSIAAPMQASLKIGYSRYPYPPLHYNDDNKELIGFDIDLAIAAMDLMKTTAEFVAIDWTNRAEALESGEVDILWGGLERASLNESKLKFTKSYLRSNIVLLMNPDRDYRKWEDLQGLNVCALNFTPAFYYLQVYNRDVIKSRRSYTPPEYQPLLTALSTGEFDCLITDTSFASFLLKTTGSDYKMSDTVMGSNYAAAVRIEDTDLFDALQEALNTLDENGTIRLLTEKWISH